MPDYEDMILTRQEMMEIYEDDPDMYDMLSACDTCYLYDRGIPCGVRDCRICKREV